VVEGLAALRGFLPELHDGFVECLQDYANEYSNREVILRQDSPSGEKYYKIVGEIINQYREFGSAYIDK
jgi:hypothetical protein